VAVVLVLVGKLHLVYFSTIQQQLILLLVLAERLAQATEARVALVALLQLYLPIKLYLARAETAAVLVHLE
jgi:hypothetical protein